MMQEFVQQVENLARGVLNEVHTAVPGVISSYDAGSGTASVKPKAELNSPDGRKFPYPEVSGVPVVFPQGNSQKSAIGFPVKSGDTCLLIICENDLQPFVNEDKSTGSCMKFDLTNAICIPGMFRSGSEAAKKADSENAIVIMNEGDAVIMLKKEEISFSLKDKSITIKPDKIEINGDVLVHGTVTEG